MEGHAGDGVTAATLNLSDGSHVQTTVQNGWMVAWWPGSANVTSAQVTTASGTTTQDFKTQPTGNCPHPTPGNATPKDVACESARIAGQGTGRATGSMSMFNAAGDASQPPAGVGGTVTSTGGNGQAQGSGTVTGSSGG